MHRIIYFSFIKFTYISVERNITFTRSNLIHPEKLAKNKTVWYFMKYNIVEPDRLYVKKELKLM
jgi:hypothetical protein